MRQMPIYPAIFLGLLVGALSACSESELPGANQAAVDYEFSVPRVDAIKAVNGEPAILRVEDVRAVQVRLMEPK